MFTPRSHLGAVSGWLSSPRRSHSSPGSAFHVTLPFPVPPAGRGDRDTASHVLAGTLADTVLNCKIHPGGVPWI